MTVLEQAETIYPTALSNCRSIDDSLHTEITKAAAAVIVEAKRAVLEEAARHIERTFMSSEVDGYSFAAEIREFSDALSEVKE